MEAGGPGVNFHLCALLVLFLKCTLRMVKEAVLSMLLGRQCIIYHNTLRCKNREGLLEEWTNRHISWTLLMIWKKNISELSLWYLRLSLPKCDISLICTSCQISARLKSQDCFPSDLVTVTWLYTHREIPLRNLIGLMTFTWTADVGWDSTYNFRK